MSLFAIVIMLSVFALVAIGMRRSASSGGGAWRTIGVSIALIGGLLLLREASSTRQSAALQVAKSRHLYTIGAERQPFELLARTPVEHDRLLKIRANARQPDVMRTDISGGEGFEIYPDGMIIHYSQGTRELFRDPGLSIGRVTSTDTRIQPMTQRESKLLEKFRLAAAQPDADQNISGGEGFETYADGMIVHVSSGKRTLFRESEQPPADDDVLAARLQQRQPSARLQPIDSNRMIESYPDGAKVLFDRDQGQRYIVSLNQHAANEGSYRRSASRLNYAGIGLIGLVVVVLLYAARRYHRQQHGTGLGWVAVGLLLLICVGGSLIVSRSRRIDVVRAYEADVQQQAAKSIDEAWDQLNAPTIHLDETNDDDVEAAAKESSPPETAKPENPRDADAPADETVVAADSSESPAEVPAEVPGSEGTIEEVTEEASDEASDEQIEDDVDSVEPTAPLEQVAEQDLAPAKAPDEDRPAAELAPSEVQDPPAREEPKAEAAEAWEAPATEAVYASTSSARSGPSKELRDAFEEVPQWEAGGSSSESDQPKPDWVVNPPKRVGNVAERVVKSGLFSTVDECFVEIGPELHSQAMKRVQVVVQEAYGRRSPSVGMMDLGSTELLRRFCHEQFVETQETGVGDMKQLYVLMRFDDEADQYLLQRWTERNRSHRLVVVAVVFGLALGLITLGYGLLKLDTVTRGYYTKRLFIGVPAAIMLVLFLFAALA